MKDELYQNWFSHANATTHFGFRKFLENFHCFCGLLQSTFKNIYPLSLVFVLRTRQFKVNETERHNLNFNANGIMTFFAFKCRFFLSDYTHLFFPYTMCRFSLSISNTRSTYMYIVRELCKCRSEATEWELLFIA